MGITKNNKRKRKTLPKKRVRNTNLIRIPTDNTISLVVWDDVQKRAVRTPLSTEEAGNVAMYLAKSKKVIGPHGQELVSKAANDANEIKYLQEALNANSKFIREQEDARRKLANDKRDMSQVVNCLCNAHRQLIDVIQGTMGRMIIPEPDMLGSSDRGMGMAKQAMRSEEPPRTSDLIDKIMRG